jgi:hypothetical protein
MEEAEGEELEEYCASLEESWNDYSNNNDGSGTLQRKTQTGNGGKDAVEEAYFMSGAGTQIYMAVEIHINNRYNLKVDVYSWAMVVYEMMTLQKPFPWYSMEDHIQHVCKGGDRPSLEDQDNIPAPIKDLLAAAWVGDVSERPSMAAVCQQLQGIALAAEVAEEQAETPVDCSRPLYRLSSHIVEKVTEATQRVFAVFDWTRRSFLSLFRRSSQDAATVLPSVQDTPTQEKDAADEPSAPYTNMEQEEETSDHGEGVRQSPENSPSTPSMPLQEVKPLKHSRHSLLKRKTSTASTTATTDDEFDDDDFLGGGYSPGMLKSLGSMEVVIERRADSERSTA